MLSHRVPPSTTARRSLVVAAAVLVGVAVLAGCSDDEPTAVAEQAGPATAVQLVTPEEAVEVIEENAANPDLVILDVRTAEEFDESRIDGAINLDLQDPGFAAGLDALDRDATYVVYCRSGNRSQAATAQMDQAGFTTVYEIEGGIVAWTDAGLPVV